MRDPLLAFSAPQLWIINFMLVVGVFLLGIWVGGVRDATEIPPPTVQTVPVLAGNFEDVEMYVDSSMGNRWMWLCDLHLSSDESTQDTAECEYRQ